MTRQNVVTIDTRAPDDIGGDRLLIETTASYVTNLWTQVNAADFYITAGRMFKNLHKQLSRHSAHDRNRIGWHRAFSPAENKFGCDRRTAERYIATYDAFFHVGNACPTWKLPQSLRALHLLATLKLDDKKPLTVEKLKKCIDDGSIGQHSTEADIRRVAQVLDLVPPKKKQPARTTFSPLIECVNDVKERIDKVVDDLTAAERDELFLRLRHTIKPKRPAPTIVDEINAFHREAMTFMTDYARRFAAWRESGPLIDGDGKAALMQAFYLCADSFARLAQDLDGR